MRKDCSWVFYFLACLVMWEPVVHVGATTSAAPSPSMDCSNAILSLSGCLSFVEKGSKVAKPEGTCCSALKTVVMTQEKCLCEAFKSSVELGISLNMTKALSLPSACKVSTPSISNCNIGGMPSAAPAPSPSPFFSNAPGSSPLAPVGVQAPSSAPAPSPSPFFSNAPGSSPLAPVGVQAPSSAPALQIPAIILLVNMAVALYSF